MLEIVDGKNLREALIYDTLVPYPQREALGGEIFVVQGIGTGVTVGCEEGLAVRGHAAYRGDAVVEALFAEPGVQAVVVETAAGSQVEGGAVEAAERQVSPVMPVAGVAESAVNYHVGHVLSGADAKAQGRQMRRRYRPFGHSVPVLADSGLKIELGAAQTVGVVAERHQTGHHVFGIGPAGHSDPVHGAVGEIELQTVGSFIGQQRIGHVAERAGAEHGAHSVFQLGAAHTVAGIDLCHLLQQFGVFHALSGEFHGRDLDFCGRYVGGCVLGGQHRMPGGTGSNHVQFGVVLQRRSITAAEYGVDGFGTEAHHVVALEIRAYAHIRLRNALVVGLAGEHVYHLGDDVTDVVDLDVGFVNLTEHHSYNDVRTHSAREVCGEVVAHTAVGQHHALVAHRIEEAGDAHRGSHRQRHVTAGPVLGLARNEVGRYAEEGYGKLGEGDGIAVAHGEAGKGVLHVYAAHPSGRKAGAEAALGTILRMRDIGIAA